MYLLLVLLTPVVMVVVFVVLAPLSPMDMAMHVVSRYRRRPVAAVLSGARDSAVANGVALSVTGVSISHGMELLAAVA